jgi:hypothetical protein
VLCELDKTDCEHWHYREFCNWFSNNRLRFRHLSLSAIVRTTMIPFLFHLEIEVVCKLERYWVCRRITNDVCSLYTFQNGGINVVSAYTGVCAEMCCITKLTVVRKYLDKVLYFNVLATERDTGVTLQKCSRERKPGEHEETSSEPTVTYMRPTLL